MFEDYIVGVVDNQAIMSFDKGMMGSMNRAGWARFQSRFLA